MHTIQEKLLKVIDEKNVGGLTLRQIGDLIDEKFPQKVKHHLSQLERKGFIMVDRKNKTSKAEIMGFSSNEDYLIEEIDKMDYKILDILLKNSF